MGLFDGFRRKHESNVNKGASEETIAEEVSGDIEPEAEAPTIEDAPTEAEELTPDHEAQEVAAQPFTQRVQETTEQQPVQGAEETATQTPDETAAQAPEETAEQTPAEVPEEASKAPVTHAIGETKILAIINQKGGVGKSTTAINLAAALGVQNKAVLVVDLDPQGNTTSGFGVDKGQVQCDVYDVLIGEQSAEQAIISGVCRGVDLLPATINLAGAEVELVSEMARENRLKSALGALRGKYDYIFIDCPPALGLLTVNALVASDKLLIPIQCEFYALEGVTKLLDSMKRVKNVLNPSLDTFGVLLTMYDGRTMLARQVVEEVQAFFGSRVFKTIIPRTVRLSEAPSFGQPITEYDPNGRGAGAYMELAKEVIQRG